MSEAFGSDYLTIEDEDGNEFELEVLNEFELDGQDYLAALPADGRHFQIVPGVQVVL